MSNEWPDPIQVNHPKFRNLTGHRFGRLTPLYPAKRTAAKKIVWLCECDCGNKSLVICGDLTSNRTQSCGCMQREQSAVRAFTHGHSDHPLYNTWERMVARCHNPADYNYSRYGARGIKVHISWQNHPDHFYAYVSSLPFFGEPGRNLDRIDNNKGYEPGNLRWATFKEQARNTRKNYLIIFRGQEKCLSEWAEELGIHRNTIQQRIRHGWPIERALTEPTHDCGRKMSHG